MERVFRQLRKAGVERQDLYVAWDFTVASERNLSERVLRIRDDAMAALPADGVPAFTITPAAQVTDRSRGGGRVVEGTFEVPLFLTDGGVPGSRLAYGPDGLPHRTGTYTAKFDCVLPAVAGPPGGRAQALVYGHGLLGSRGEVLGFGRYADTHQSVLCATDWIGLAEEDVGNAIAILQDLSHMPTMPDRVQQSFVNFQYLARLLRSPGGFATAPAFQGADGRSVFATGDVAYWGRSQGGIFGGGATAISVEWTRAVLGEAATNYSTLLSRSVDFDDFSPVAEAAYPDLTDRPLLQNLMQMLWDRGESNGYAAHISGRPAARDPEAHRPRLRGVRRPPGRQRGDGGHGSHDGRATAGAGARPRAVTGRRPVLGHPVDPPLPLPRIGAADVGLRHPTTTARQRAAPRPGVRRRPTRHGPRNPRGARGGGPLPCAGRLPRARLRWCTLRRQAHL